MTAASATSPPANVHERVGPYELIRSLGQGGMAEVFLARRVFDTVDGASIGHLVALKRILPALTVDDALVGMIVDEAKLCAQLNHPNVVGVYEFGKLDEKSDTSSYYFTMDYVHGVDLRAVLAAAAKQKTGMTMSQALTVVCHAASGLHHAHEACDQSGAPLGIVHRDVTPNNILIGYDGTVKVADFGIAKARSRSTKTATGMVKGKVAYLSPEQARAHPLDRRSDVFALGIILFELTTGTRLFGKMLDDFAVMHALVNEPLPTPSSRRVNYPAALEAIVMKALATDPCQRFATALELRRALETFAREEQLLVSETSLHDLMHKLFGAVPVPQHARAHAVDAVPVEAQTSTTAMLSTSSPAVRRVSSRGTVIALLGAAVGAAGLTALLMNRADPEWGQFVPGQLLSANTRPGAAPPIRTPRSPAPSSPSAQPSAAKSANSGNPATSSSNAPPRVAFPRPRITTPKPPVPPPTGGTDDGLL